MELTSRGAIKGLYKTESARTSTAFKLNMHFVKLATLIFVNSILCAIGVGRECEVQFKYDNRMDLRPRKRAFESKIQSQQTNRDI